MDWIVLALACLALLGWLAPLAEALLYGRRLPPLDRIQPQPPAGGWPPVSIVVPACNEEAAIEPAMRSLLALDYPDLEIIAVDDRSTDRTGPILDALAAGDGRLRVKRLTRLPEGWLGKSHALAAGAADARGAFILFTDADVLLEPTALRRAVSRMARQGLDHLAIGSEVILRGWLERSLVSYFMFLFAARFRPWRVADPRSRAYVGIGAFNMVRADAYRAAGGHAAMPLDVLDDVKLGKLIKRRGGRLECLPSGGLVRVRWVDGVGGLVRGLEKNAFAGFGYNPLLAMAGAAATLGLAWIPWAALGLGPAPARAAGLAALALMALTARTFAAERGVTFHHALGYPLAAAVMVWTIMRSMLVAYRRGGVEWRGTFYRLEELRRARF